MIARMISSLGAACAAVLVSGCAGQWVDSGENIGLSAKEFEVDMVPQGPSGTLKVDSGNNGCPNGQHKGCMRFEENTIGLIKFFLPGGKQFAKTCQANAQNVITRIELATSGSGEKGDFSATPLDGWIKTEAFPQVDLATGVVYQRDLASATNQVWLVNINANNPDDGVKDFWYQVTAQSCDDLDIGPEEATHTWTTDPRGENTGTKK